MPFDTYAYFYVRDFEGSPQNITDLLELEPTRSWQKDELGQNGHQHKFNKWELHSPLPRTELFQDSHLVVLLDILERKKKHVRNVIANFECGLQCVGYYTNEHPGFHMDSKLISRVAALGLCIDFDLYCWCDHEETKT